MAIKRNERIENERGLSFENTVSDLMPYLDTPYRLEIELGRAKMSIGELLDLDVGSLVDLRKSAGEPMDVLCKDRILIRGEVTVLEDNLGLRVTEIVDPNRKV